MLPPPHFWTSIQPLLTWGRGRPPAWGSCACACARACRFRLFESLCYRNPTKRTLRFVSLELKSAFIASLLDHNFGFREKDLVSILIPAGDCYCLAPQSANRIAQ